MSKTACTWTTRPRRRFATLCNIGASKADIMDIEFVHKTKDTTVEQMKEKLFFGDLAWKLR
jgi:hypothetical protein